MPITGNWLSVTNQAPSKLWANESLRPKNAVGRLFCQTLLPKEYTGTLHADGRTEIFNPAGHPQANGVGNAFHLHFGQKVIQIEPAMGTTQMVFLHVLTAVDADQAQPPQTAYRVIQPGLIEVTVDRATTRFSVPPALLAYR